MDLVTALAADVGADIALANDPDADRLGVAIPHVRTVGWRRLTGDEIGWLLADHILGHTSGDDRLVVTTLVSSSLLGRMAAAAGVHHAETFTGLQVDRPHGARAARTSGSCSATSRPSATSSTDRPRDKDGITAAVADGRGGGAAPAPKA